LSGTVTMLLRKRTALEYIFCWV